jgi:hypothetical protein
MKGIPNIGEIYNCFDDGKIRESRLYTVKVTNIIPAEKINNNICYMWNEEVKQCDWLYSPETDFFVITENQDGEEEIFVRTIDNEWFSIGSFLGCGIMDIDGELTKRIMKNKV